MRPDDVCCEMVDRGLRLTVKELDAQTIVIEGTRETLVLLAKMIIAEAQDEAEDGFSISPFDAGRALFTEDSTRGLYIYPLGSHRAQSTDRQRGG